jgi:hypothetical protein
MRENSNQENLVNNDIINNDQNTKEIKNIVNDDLNDKKSEEKNYNSLTQTTNNSNENQHNKKYPLKRNYNCFEAILSFMLFAYIAGAYAIYLKYHILYKCKKFFVIFIIITIY